MYQLCFIGLPQIARRTLETRWHLSVESVPKRILHPSRFGWDSYESSPISLFWHESTLQHQRIPQVIQADSTWIPLNPLESTPGEMTTEQVDKRAAKDPV
uniref:Uncharacterized protein n=1 Tax=Sphaerodactylus townsendi TaxID=933632 RepID=A0ACB8G670_9SAUR